MKLSLLLENTGIHVPDHMRDTEILSIEDDSRSVAEDSLFVAVTGFQTDGHLYVDQALERGAAAVVVERCTGDDGRIIVNPEGDNRSLISCLSSVFYGNPWNDIVTVGITGTNGKTSTSRMLRWILEQKGMSCGLIGTVGHIAGGRSIDASTTTPGALETTRLMSMMRDGGDRCCVMEVSSHALSQCRVESVRYDVCLFTNISQDHLDYHESMDDYLACKVHLFDLLKKDGSSLVGTYSQGYPVIPEALTFGIRQEDDYTISDVSADLASVSFTLSHMGESAGISMKVPGRFNVFNAAGAAAAAHRLGIPLEDSALALAGFTGVPGRFQAVDSGQDFLVAVDYAHTPDALERVLRQAAELTRGKLITVFGAGGDRDRRKRPLMGRIASSLSTVTYVTSDNPRTEDPDAIIADILEGIPMELMDSVRVESDRRQAIRSAIGEAAAGDVVIIAGKGHEDYQILGRTKIHFDDREEAAAAISEAGSP